ncbi:MAG: ROK family protein [Bacteroidales bacterium]|nr:ROK family protein [Bacteroidales bacterium]MCF8455250.1 ROK family protein [Bacteroidales bacterium]
MEVLGIDIGGSGIKGAMVNTETGELVGERHRIETPQPAKPQAIAETIKAIANHFDYKGKIGCGFPAVMQNGVIKTASNIHKSNIDVDANKLFSKVTGCEVNVFNDADVAGYAELKFGKYPDFKGMALFLTIGSGIGSALFYKGMLIPNTEFGHLFMDKGLKCEHYASDAVRKKKEMSWEKWGKRFNEVLQYLEFIFSPELIILGGGTSKKFDLFEMQLKIKAPVEPAKLLNQAGIIGGAMLA